MRLLCPFCAAPVPTAVRLIEHIAVVHYGVQQPVLPRRKRERE